MQGVDCYEHIGHHDDLAGFVQKHATLIHKMAWHIKNRLPVHIELDDLIQSGLIGLLEARNTFSEAGGASFNTYASLKIRCAIYEFVRKNSGITRDISQNIKKISSSISRIENSDEALLSDQSIADEMGVSLKKYADMTREISAYKAISMQELDVFEDVVCENTLNPLQTLEAESDKAMIKSVLKELPKREQIILALYYNNQLNFKEIADIMDLTEARISQIHTALLSKLKRKLTYQNEYQL